MPNVLVVAESRAGEVRKVALELLSAARSLAAGGEVHAHERDGHERQVDDLELEREALALAPDLAAAVWGDVGHGAHREAPSASFWASACPGSGRLMTFFACLMVRHTALPAAPMPPARKKS